VVSIASGKRCRLVFAMVFYCDLASNQRNWKGKNIKKQYKDIIGWFAGSVYASLRSFMQAAHDKARIGAV
jgi:hypothetical protein